MNKPEKLNEWVTLYEGRCEDVLATGLIPTNAAIISDPPYGMNWNTDSTRFSGGRGKRGEGREDWGEIVGDTIEFDPLPWLSFPRVVLWGSNHYAARLPVGTGLVWLKKPDHLFGTFLSDAEVAWMKGGCGIYCFRDTGEYMRIQKNKFHPTQKPVNLMRWCIRKAKVPPGSVIVDPYAGSGTTLIAAMLEGRQAIGCEIDPAYCDIIRRRVREADGTAPGTLFAEAAKQEASLFDSL